MELKNSFNPWYVGGGVKSSAAVATWEAGAVSILGMLEGVLKDLVKKAGVRYEAGFNPWYVGGGVKK